MGDMKTTRTPKSDCPYCGDTMDAATSREGATPKPDDLSLCWKCGGFLRFAEDLTLRPLSEEEFDALGPQNREELLLFRRAIVSMAKEKP